MPTKVKISAVSYLNTRPFVYGLQTAASQLNYVLELNPPSICSEKLVSGRIDVGLIPVAKIPEVENARIISNYCIGADGPVKSVLLLSRVPLEQIKTIYLDFESRTSVRLAQLLAHHFWHIQVEWKALKPAHLNQLDRLESTVLIGDKTFDVANNFPLQWDLAEEWIHYTGLPFVFAAWVANKALPKEWETEFNQAMAFGVKNIEACISKQHTHNYPKLDILKYYQNNISFTLDAEKQKGMDLFLKMIKP